jgi:hypothetical protein
MNPLEIPPLNPPLKVTDSSMTFAPVAGSPQSLAFCRSVRWRQVTPPSQVFEQPWRNVALRKSPDP